MYLSVSVHSRHVPICTVTIKNTDLHVSRRQVLQAADLVGPALICCKAPGDACTTWCTILRDALRTHCQCVGLMNGTCRLRNLSRLVGCVALSDIV